VIATTQAAAAGGIRVVVSMDTVLPLLSAPKAKFREPIIAPITPTRDRR
jgi:hypothetical protein